MAQGTDYTAPPVGCMAPTPGITPGTTAPAPEPTLVEGIDPVLLHRLYPEADSIADLYQMALERGKKTAAEGAELQAAQQVPVP